MEGILEQGFPLDHMGSTEDVLSMNDLVTIDAQLSLLWLLICTSLVLLMQAGFTCLEAGCVRSKNTINVAIKNFADFCLSSIVFWCVGFGLMFGSSVSGLFGTDGFFYRDHSNAWLLVLFMFQLMFCGTTSTIISGAVAERISFRGYLLITVITATMIYPVIGHWIWAKDSTGNPVGWLAAQGFIDFAGGTVVHSVGGWVALAAVLVIGPRAGRFTSSENPFPGHNLPLSALGVFLIWCGWLGFNGGSTFEFSDKIPSILLVTTFGGAAGGLGAIGATWSIKKVPHVPLSLNGALGGMVTVTPAANLLTLPDSVFLGFLAGFTVVVSSMILDHWKIDDAIGAIPVHGFCGVLGTMAIPFFCDPHDIASGLDRWEQLGIQALGVLSVVGWAFGLGFRALFNFESVFSFTCL